MTVIQLHQRNGSTGAPKPPDNSDIIAALDIGSSKVCCLIGEVVKAKARGGDSPAQEIKVLGLGHQVSRGVKCGAIVDIEEAERSIRLAVDAAERMAGVTIPDVYVSVAGGRPQCHAYSGEARIMGAEISGADVQRAVAAAMQQVDPGKRVLLHATPVQFHVDDARGVKSPEGMFGETLVADVNAVTVEAPAIRNLTLAVERCHLQVKSYVIAPYAGARAVLVPDEMALGVTFIDMGGSTTSVSVYQDGRLVFADVIPIGGQHITNDIARGLATPVAHAERLKTLHGSAIPTLADERELVAVPLMGERGVDTIHKVPRSKLVSIIRPRLEETFELVRDRLAASAFGEIASRRLVLSGGASQLTGVRELASEILSRHARAGFPRPLRAMPQTAHSPAFSVAAGLLDFALKPDVRLVPGVAGGKRQGRDNYLLRVGRWITESF